MGMMNDWDNNEIETPHRGVSIFQSSIIYPVIARFSTEIDSRLVSSLEIRSCRLALLGMATPSVIESDGLTLQLAYSYGKGASRKVPGHAVSATVWHGH